MIKINTVWWKAKLLWFFQRVHLFVQVLQSGKPGEYYPTQNTGDVYLHSLGGMCKLLINTGLNEPWVYILTPK